MNYSDIIKNKRVIFVGGCPNLKGKGYGKEIDNYDVVVRTNGSIDLIQNPEIQKDYGKRCDVLYCNVQFLREMQPLPLDRYLLQGVKHLCFKTASEKILNDYNQTIPSRHIKHVIPRVQKKVYGALMGLFLIQDILDHEPKELFITGIDFFVSKKAEFEHDNYKEYLDGYLPDKIRKQGNKINKGKKEDGHNMLENTKYIHRLWQKGLVKMPEFIEKIMIGIVEGRLTQQ